MKNMLELSNEKQSVLRTAARKEFINYCEVIDEKYQANWHHEVIADILQKALGRVLKGEDVRIILEVPPRHGKSDETTIKFPSWVLGEHPSIPVIVSSYSADLAEDFGQKTRDLMNSQSYQDIFSTRLREDTKSKGRWLTQSDGGYTAVGVGGAITGRGFKIGIIDDPYKNREEADSDTIRAKVWNWWTSTFYTRQEGATAIIIIMTRWHTADLVGQLLEEQQRKEEAGETNIDEWEVIRFPAIADEDEAYRKKGEALWPAKFNLAKLEKTRSAIGVMDFEALYQQSPLNALHAEFKREYWRYFEEKELPSDFDIDITIDPAISQKKKACNTAIVAVGKARTDPSWYILDYKADKFDPGQLIEATFSMYLEFRVKYPFANIRVFIEGVAYQESLKYFFEEEMKRRRVFFFVETFIDRHDKEQRIRGLIPMYKIGLIKHRMWMNGLEKELLKFPKGQTIDIADALSFQIGIKQNTDRSASTYEQPEREPASMYEG